ncbi:MAG: hypothetical protein ACPHID_06945 [Thermoplasmatota archaeon]
MAKRNKAEEPAEGEEYQFIPPDFDEDQFIHKEMVSFHTTVVLFFAGIVAAIASWGAFAALDGARTGWLVGMVILAIAFAFLRPLFRILKIDIAHWARREWIGTGFLMFFTWLAFFIMLVNPPVSDFADPQANLYVTPTTPIAGEDVTLDLFLHDNDAIAGYTSTLTGPNGLVTVDLIDAGPDHEQATLRLGPGDYSWFVHVDDTNDLSRDVWHNFTVTAGGLDVSIDADDIYPVQARVPGDAKAYWAVYADIAGGDRVYLEYEDRVGAWVATTNFEGWNAGNNTFTVIAEEKNRFDGNTLLLGGTHENGPHSLFVANPGDYDDSIPSRANPTDPPVVNIPGLEVPLLIAGLIAVAFIARRRS